MAAEVERFTGVSFVSAIVLTFLHQPSTSSSSSGMSLRLASSLRSATAAVYLRA